MRSEQCHIDSRQRIRERRGAALLIVLAVVVLTLTATANLARLASTASLERSLNRSTTIADDLLVASDEPLKRWLEDLSHSVVLPSDVDRSHVRVLKDTIETDGLRAEIDMTAWDQRGMFPLQAAVSGSALRMVLSNQILSRLENMPSVAQEPYGLDLLLTDPSHKRDGTVFPSSSEESAIAIGDVICTHPPGGDIRINVNTAPIPLVEAAMRLAGRGGIEQIIAARDQGKPAAVGSFPALFESQTDAPQFISSSDCWGFRIDIRVDSIRRSWWAIYQLKSSDWECVQRLAITY